MVVGSGHIDKRRELKSFEKVHNITENAGHGAKYRCRAQSMRGDGNWNERSPLVWFKMCVCLIKLGDEMFIY